MATIQKKVITESLDAVNKDPSKINSELLRFANSLINDLKLKGYDYRIFEGYRTNERQNYLYSVKKTTSLKGGQSKHNKLPSEAVSIVQYLKGQPVWGGSISGQEFKTIVNDKLLSYPNIIWGGNPYRKREVMELWDRGEILPNWYAKISLEEGLKKIVLNSRYI